VDPVRGLAVHAGGRCTDLLMNLPRGEWLGLNAIKAIFGETDVRRGRKMR